MRFAKLENSPRLQRVLAALKKAQQLTTRQIMSRANVCAVNSCIAELRANGYDIACTCTGRGRFVYRLMD